MIHRVSGRGQEDTSWRRPVEHPVMTQVDRPGKDKGTRIEHPAYAVIQANRISGGQNLFGSEFMHGGFIRITVKKAYVERSLSHDFVHDDRPHYVSVDLSEAQWAQFVSTQNSGVGTQCTLNRVNGEWVPGIPDPEDKLGMFDREMLEKGRMAKEQVTLLKKMVADSSMTKAKKEEFQNVLLHLGYNVDENAKFVAKSFGEHIETMVTKAKAEVAGFMANALRMVGIDALSQRGIEPPTVDMPTLPPKKED